MGEVQKAHCHKNLGCGVAQRLLRKAAHLGAVELAAAQVGVRKLEELGLGPLGNPRAPQGGKGGAALGQ